jgi:hypothetical protein
MKSRKKLKALRHQRARERAEIKKRSRFRKRKRNKRLLQRKADINIRRAIKQKPSISQTAPSNFSLIDNTDEVVAYINNCKKLLHEKEKVTIDIANIQTLTSDAIALLVACADDPHFRGKYGELSGNAPKDIKLLTLFMESGFYKFVRAHRFMKTAQKERDNLLHKESNFKVQPDIAREACLHGTQHLFNNKEPINKELISCLYEMIIEAMSNTNNHANKDKEGGTKWWLYAYNDPEGKTCYSFVDLGVGIFESLPVKIYKKIAMKFGFSHNADLVNDLLEGKIKSSKREDNNIRGKGIPQIANNSQKDIFKRAFIISNDVKIDLKSRRTEKLSNDFHGTLLYWELTKQGENNG